MCLRGAVRQPLPFNRKKVSRGTGRVRVLDLGGLVKVLAFDDDW